MYSKINIFSEKNGEIELFLSKFYNTPLNLTNHYSWEKEYLNPIEVTDIISALIDNSDMFNIKIWITLDSDVYIQINKHNAEYIIQYLFERFPY